MANYQLGKIHFLAEITFFEKISPRDTHILSTFYLVRPPPARGKGYVFSILGFWPLPHSQVSLRAGDLSTRPVRSVRVGTRGLDNHVLVMIFFLNSKFAFAVHTKKSFLLFLDHICGLSSHISGNFRISGLITLLPEQYTRTPQPRREHIVSQVRLDLSF